MCCCTLSAVVDLLTTQSPGTPSLSSLCYTFRLSRRRVRGVSFFPLLISSSSCTHDCNQVASNVQVLQGLIDTGKAANYTGMLPSSSPPPFSYILPLLLPHHLALRFLVSPPLIVSFHPPHYYIGVVLNDYKLSILNSGYVDSSWWVNLRTVLLISHLPFTHTPSLLYSLSSHSVYINQT